MTKQCNKCSELKSLTEFFIDRNNKTNGRYSICKACKKERVYKWRENNRDQYNATQRNYTSKNYAALRLNRYKITLPEYEKLLADQKGLCAICGKSNPSDKREMAIDHDHVTGKVRGILCYGCNRLMVLLDNTELLTKAEAYKKKFS
jgi:Autographiviridae endonuclease VII